MQEGCKANTLLFSLLTVDVPAVLVVPHTIFISYCFLNTTPQEHLELFELNISKVPTQLRLQYIEGLFNRV